MALSKSTLKYIRSLHLKKFRQNYNKFPVEGDKIVRELLHQRRFRVDSVFALPQWIGQHSQLLQQLPPENVHAINGDELQQISQMPSPNFVLAIVDMPPHPTPPDLSGGWSIFLDGIQDPGNAGTILRIADWFGFKAVIAGEGTVELYNHKVLQSAMGAFLRVPWWEASLETLLAHYPTLTLWAADMDGHSLYEVVPPGEGILIVGNEGRGLSAATLAQHPFVVSIPAPEHGGAESLNAAVATGICCAFIAKPR